MNSEIESWHLRNHSICKSASENDIRALHDVCSFMGLTKGHVIYKHDKPINKFYLLLLGRVKTSYYQNEHAECVSEILKEGDLFGELTLKQSLNINCEFAQVLSDEAIIGAVTLNDFEKLMKNHPALSCTYALIIAEKLKIISAKYCNLAHKDVRSRVLGFFKVHPQYEGKWTDEKVEIDMYCSHQDIANFTASSRQTVSTIINDLIKERKLIYMGRSRLIIPDIRQLEC